MPDRQHFRPLVTIFWIALMSCPAIVCASEPLTCAVTWTNLMGASATGASLRKTAAIGWNAGAFSTRALVSGDGSVEFTATETNATRMLGLSRDNTNTDFSDIDFALYLYSNGSAYVVEGGLTRSNLGSYAAGDRFRVAVEGGIVKYRRNGVLVYTSGVTPAYPLLVDTALYSPAATLTDVVLSGDLGEAVAWTAAARVSAWTGALTKTGVLGWNAGTISTRAMASGDGFVSFTTSEATTHKLIGLSRGNTNTDYADIDFGILLAANGTYYVFENGASRGVFGAYLANDRFEVAVRGGIVKYLKNAAVFYTSGVAPAYPLLVDTALYTPGSTIVGVVLGCAGGGCQPVPNCPAGVHGPDCVSPGEPTLQQPPAQTSDEGRTITPLEIVASDANGSPLTYAVEFLPLGLAFNPANRMISGTVDWQAAETLGLPAATVRVTVTNLNGFLTRKTFAWTVNNRNAPPSAVVSPTLPRDSSGAYLVSTERRVAIAPLTLAVTDPDPCDVVGFHVGNGEALPPGITLSPSGVSNPGCTPGLVFPAIIGGTPATEGVTTFTIRSDNGSPLATFIWTVTPNVCDLQTTLSRSAIATSGAARADGLTIAAPENCSWTVESASWIETTPVSGQGSGTIGFVLSANATGVARTGTILAGGQALTIVQAAAPCAATVSPAAISAGQSGSSGTVQASVPWGCALPATTDAPGWVHVTSAGYEATVIRDGASGYWRLGDLTGEVATDRSGHAFHGLYSGSYAQGMAASFADGDAASRFDGGYVSIPYQGDLDPGGGSFSIEAWVRLTIPATGIVAGSYAMYGDYPYGYALRLTEGRAQLRGDSGAVIVAADSSRVLTDGIWHHLVATVDGASSEVSLFVDGVLEGTSTTPELFYGGDFSIAGSLDGATDLVTASIDEVAFYRQPLTSSQIQEHFAAEHDSLTDDGALDWPISYTIDANPFGLARNGAIVVTDQTVSIVQPGISCSFSVSPAGASVPASQTSGTIVVTSAAGCAWSPATNVPWLTLSGRQDGYGGQILADGATAYWRLNETSGTVAADASGHGYSGTYNEGGAYTPGVAGAVAGDGAVSFTDGSAYVSTADVFVAVPDGPMSLEAWVQYTGTGGTVVDQGAYVLLLQGEHARFRARGIEGDRFRVNGVRSLNDGTWHHVVAVVDPANHVATLFADGVVDATRSFSGTSTYSSPAFIGANAIADIDEVAIYEHVLTSAQVAEHYLQRVSPGGGNGRFTYTAAFNPTLDARIGDIDVAGAVIPISQSGAGCLSAAPGSVSVGPSGDSGTIEISAVDSGCAWTAAVGVTWVTIDVTAGTGAGQLHYTVAANPTRLTRTAALTLPNTTIVITQSGLAPERPGFHFSVAAAAHHSLALGDDGRVWSWGANDYNQLGDGTSSSRWTPVQIPSPTDIVAIAAGDHHSLALKNDGSVWAWGAAYRGQLGDGILTYHETPVQTSNLENVVAVAAGSEHSVALAADGRVWTWGRNDAGQLGDGSGSDQATPVLVTGVPAAVAVAAAGGRTLVVDTAGGLWMFGAGTVTPTQVALASPIATPAAAPYGSFAIGVDGPVWAWGLNNLGQLGDGSTANQDSPQLLTTIDGVAQMSASNHTLALKADGTVFSWGQNSSGQLGNGVPPCAPQDVDCWTQQYSATPIALSDLVNVVAVSANGSTSLAVTGDGHVWTWGKNDEWQLGDGTAAARSTPTPIADANLLWYTGTPVLVTATGTYVAPFVAHGFSTTAEATIHYTTDCRDPEESDPVFPIDGLSITETTTLKLRAWAPDKPPSNIASATYTLTPLAPLAW